MTTNSPNRGKPIVSYDNTESALKRALLKYDDYVAGYDDFVSVYNIKTDGDEMQFVKLDLDIFKDLAEYLLEVGQGEDNWGSVEIFDFNKRYKPYWHIIKTTITHLDTVENSLERKCIFLRNRLDELTATNNTLNQRLLLIKYLDRSKKIVLSQIHPDNTGQAQVLKFLMNAGYQSVRSGLGRNINQYKNEKDLKVLLDLLKPYKRYFKDVITEIEKDLHRKNM